MGNQQASKALLKGINYAIDNKLNKAPMDKTFTGLIKNVKDNNIYDVLIQGKLYTNIPSMFKGLKVNETVKIKSPQNQYSQMYIEGKYNMIDYEYIMNKLVELENEIEQLKGGTN